MQGLFFLKLMGNVSEMLFKVVDGYIVLRNIYPSALSLFEASKMSQKHFPLCPSPEVPWKLPQIFMLDKHWCTEVLLAPVKESVPQREMTLCHTGAERIYKHNSKRSRAFKKASFVLRHPCPPVTYLWKPWGHGSFEMPFTPAPTSLLHTHVSAYTHTNHLRHMKLHLYQPSKVLWSEWKIHLIRSLHRIHRKF